MPLAGQQVDDRVGLCFHIDAHTVGHQIVGPVVHEYQGHPLGTEHLDVLLVVRPAQNDPADLAGSGGDVLLQRNLERVGQRLFVHTAAHVLCRRADTCTDLAIPGVGYRRNGLRVAPIADQDDRHPGVPSLVHLHVGDDNSPGRDTVDQPLGAKQVQGVAHGRPGHLVLLGDPSLGQLRPGRQAARQDLLREDPGQTAGISARPD